MKDLGSRRFHAEGEGGMKKIFIKPDMTAADREEDWRLRQELKKKRQESEEKQGSAK